MSEFKIFIANNPEALEALNPVHTVEAEFGATCVVGSETTLAHHGPRSGNPCPCLGESFPQATPGVIAISHLDLDTLGGIQRVLGRRPQGEYLEEVADDLYNGDGNTLFWAIAAQIDTQGPHRLDEIKRDVQPRLCYDGNGTSMCQADVWVAHEERTIDRLHAFWAWSEANRLFPDREGAATDCSKFVFEALRVLEVILEGGEAAQPFLQAGESWAKDKEKLEQDSLVYQEGPVLVRQSDQFVNHLYTASGPVVVGHNRETGAVTLSVADADVGIDCCEVMQSLFGPAAGGHAGIAGSPRNLHLSLESARGVAGYVYALLKLREAGRSVCWDCCHLDYHQGDRCERREGCTAVYTPRSLYEFGSLIACKGYHH